MNRAAAMGASSWKLPLDRNELGMALAAMLQAADRPGAGLELTLADDAAMEALNREHMNLPGPTNILSFPGSARLPGSPRPGNDFLGSLVLCPDAVLRECLLYGQNPVPHTLRLLSHGLAHLLGYDHGPAMEALAERMFKAAAQSCREHYNSL